MYGAMVPGVGEKERDERRKLGETADNIEMTTIVEAEAHKS